MVKRCLFCGRFFVPDPRVGERQKACQRDVCKKKRKYVAHRRWCEKNPDYFKDHYLHYVKPWRERRSSQGADKRQDRPAGAYLRLILPLTADWRGLIKDEIHLRRVDRRTFAAYG